MKKAVLYARVSSDRQEREGFSIPAQIKLLQEYARNNNISIVKEFVESETAKKAGRKQFNEMLKFLKKNSTVRTILVEKTDRLYRNLKDYVVLDDFEGLEIHFAKEGNILSAQSKSQDKFMHGIRVLMAKNYIDNLSEEIRKGLNEKCSQGYYPSSLPMGYVNKVNATGRKEIVIDENVAPFIRQIFESYLIGNYSYSSLALHMQQCGFYPKGRICTLKTIENILSNEFYTGIFYFKGVKYYNAKHEPIISPELFQQVQNKIKKKSHSKRTKRQFAYSGLIKCKHCGKALIAELQHGKKNSGDYVYYRCHSCKKMIIREDRFEELFNEIVLKNIHFTEEEVQQITEIAKELVMYENNFAEMSIDELHKRIQLLKRRLSQLYTDKLDGLIDNDIYMQKRNEFQQELDIALIKYDKISKISEQFVESVENLSNLCKDAPRLYEQKTQAQKRELMNLMLSNTIFDGEKIEFMLVSAFEYALNIKNVVMTGSKSNTVIKNILLDMFQNYNNINFTAINLYKKCA